MAACPLPPPVLLGHLVLRQAIEHPRGALDAAAGDLGARPDEPPAFEPPGEGREPPKRRDDVRAADRRRPPARGPRPCGEQLHAPWGIAALEPADRDVRRAASGRTPEPLA